MAPAFGIALPQSFSTEPDCPILLNEFLGLVEASVFESVWVQEQLLGTDPSLEPLASLAFAASATSTVRLGSAAVVAPLRDPILLAKTAATLDVLSGGRLILGLSIGEVAQIYEAVGVDMGERGARLDEIVEVLETLWKTQGTSHEGRFWAFQDADMEPKPRQHPAPQIWFGGHSREALARVARSGSGWIGAGGSTIEDFSHGVRRLQDELEFAGRQRSQITVAKKLYVAVDDDPSRAREGLVEWFERHWPSSFDQVRLAESVGVSGTPEQVGSVVNSAVEAGADLVILNPVFDETAQFHRLNDLLTSMNFTESDA